MANLINNLTSVTTAFVDWMTALLAVFTTSDILQLVLGISVVGIVVSIILSIVARLKA